MSIPTPIFKVNCLTGEVDGIYDKVRDLLFDNNMSYTKLRRLMALGLSCDGYFYRSSSPLPQKIIDVVYTPSNSEDIYIPYWEQKQAWEGDDGFFNIAGWRNVY